MVSFILFSKKAVDDDAWDTILDPEEANEVQFSICSNLQKKLLTRFSAEEKLIKLEKLV